MEPSKSKPGIYAIVNEADGKRTTYVGQTSRQIWRRLSRHKTDLRCHTHDNVHLQRAWDKYGESAFQFIALENVSDPSQLTEREQYWFDAVQTERPTYNHGPMVFNPIAGHPLSEEHKQKIAASHAGKHNSPETRAKISASWARRKEQFQNDSGLPQFELDRRRAHKKSPEEIAETKKKNRRPSGTGRRLTDEEKEHLRSLYKGKRQSPETVRKRAESIRRQWAERKAKVVSGNRDTKQIPLPEAML